MDERLQKLLARAGYGSRRASEMLIAAGRVSVNGRVVRGLGTKADPTRDHIEIDRQPLQLPVETLYMILHKPRGIVTTARDERGRRTVLDLAGEVGARVFPVGRLDKDSEGLLLLTNDGELANRLIHPRYALEREYFARVDAVPSDASLRQLEHGIVLDGRPTAPAQVSIARPPRVVQARPGEHWLRIIIHEGRKRQVRRMLGAIGHPVRRLVRVRMGPLYLGDLPPGHRRYLTSHEVQRLKKATGLSAEGSSFVRSHAHPYNHPNGRPRLS